MQFNKVFSLTFSISHFATTDEVTDSTIQIITIETQQYGDYICRATNILGTAEDTVTLYGKYCLH